MAKDSKTTLQARQDSAGREQEALKLFRGSATSESALRRDPETSTPRIAGPRRSIQPETVATQFTFYVNPTRALVCVPAETPALFSFGVAADLTGVHPEMLRYYCRLGLLGADRAEMEREATFDEEAIHEVRRIEHYRRHLAVNRRALPLICELRREAERQHIEIHFLRSP